MIHCCMAQDRGLPRPVSERVLLARPQRRAIINGLPPERRRQRRQLQSKPIAEALAAWANNTVRQLSRKSELAQAFRYMRARWTALARCFDDGRLALDNNPAERALRCVAIGRKNYLFAGSDAGGPRTLSLFPDDRVEGLLEDASIVGVRLSELRLRRPRQWGACWLALMLCANCSSISSG
jgi:hypothetical protein